MPCGKLVEASTGRFEDFSANMAGVGLDPGDFCDDEEAWLFDDIAVGFEARVPIPRGVTDIAG